MKYAEPHRQINRVGQCIRQYKKDIFGIMFWDIHDKVMPKGNIWAERLTIKGNLDLG